MTNITRQPKELSIEWGAQIIREGLSRRSAAEFAHFFLPHLQPGMRLLDCGCGPGSITLGLAAVVAPGEVVGIDFAPQSIAEAQDRAAKANCTNVRFEVADVYALPFPDASFDAVFSHALLHHLPEPDKALEEMRRVLRSGGLVGIRNDDMDGILMAPHEPLLFRGWGLMAQLMRANGGNAHSAKNSRAWLKEAGFTRIEASASYESFGTPGETKSWSELCIALLLNRQARYAELGLADHVAIEQICAAWQAWGTNPDAFFAKAWCEAIGWIE